MPTAREIWDKMQRHEALTPEESKTLHDALVAGGFTGLGPPQGPYWTDRGRVPLNSDTFSLTNPDTLMGPLERALPTEGTPMSALPPGYTESVSTFDPTYAVDPTVYNQAPAITVGAVAPAVDLAQSLEGGTYSGPSSYPVPTEGAGLTSPYGMRNGDMHEGVDIGKPGPGNLSGEPTVAIAPGVITGAGPVGGYGNQVAVKHPDGSKSTYSHLDSISVKKGQEIAAGWEVGKVGNTGASRGPHLHLEVYDPQGNKVDPGKLVSSLQTAAQIAAGNTTANAVGQYGPETAVLGPSLQQPLTDAPPLPPVHATPPPTETAFTPFTPSPNLAALPAAQAIQGIQVGSPALTPAVIAASQRLTPSTTPLPAAPIPAGPLPAVSSPTSPVAPLAGPLPAAASPTSSAAVVSDPTRITGVGVEVAGPPVPNAAAYSPNTFPTLPDYPDMPAMPKGSIFSPEEKAALIAGTNELMKRQAAPIGSLAAAPRLPIDTAPTNTGHSAIPMGVAPPMNGISVGMSTPVYGGITDSPAAPFSLPAATSPTNPTLSASQAPLPRAVSPPSPFADIPVGGMLPVTSPVSPVANIPLNAPAFSPPSPTAASLPPQEVFKQGPPPPSTGPTAFLTSPEANPAYAPSVPAPSPPATGFGAQAQPFTPTMAGGALVSGITIGSPWDQPAPSVYNPPDLIAGPAPPPAELTPGQLVNAHPDNAFHTVVDGVQSSPVPVAAPGVPTGIEVGAKPLPVVEAPGVPSSSSTGPAVVKAPAPQPPAAIQPAAPIQMGAPARTVTPVAASQPAPAPTANLARPITPGNLVANPSPGINVGAASPAFRSSVSPAQIDAGMRMLMEEQERQRLEVESRGISVGVGWGNGYGYGGPSSGQGANYSGGGGAYERDFGVGPIGGFGGPSWADKANYGR